MIILKDVENELDQIQYSFTVKQNKTETIPQYIRYRRTVP